MLAERLDKAWGARLRSTANDPVMRFSDEGLVLGAGTVLAKSGGSGRDNTINPLAPRLQALLAAAHLRRPTAEALAHLRKAAERWRDGQDALAAMHLVLSQVDRLEEPEADAHRLFLADGLLNAGLEEPAIIAAIEAGGPALEQFVKYNQDQPRVPAGSGRTSGEWTASDGVPASSPSDMDSRGVAQPGAASAAASGSTTKPPQTTAESLQAEVNPNTVAPAKIIEGTYEGNDACYKARLICQKNIREAAHRGQANDILDEYRYKQCSVAEG